MGSFTQNLGTPPHRELRKFLDLHSDSYEWLPTFSELEDHAVFFRLKTSTAKTILEHPPDNNTVPLLTKPVCVTDDDGSVVVYPLLGPVPVYRTLVFGTPEGREVRYVLEALVQPLPSDPLFRSWDVCPSIRWFKVDGDKVDTTYSERLCDVVHRVALQLPYSPDEYVASQSFFSDLSTSITVAFDQLVYLVEEGKLDAPLAAVKGKPAEKPTNTMNSDQIRAYWLSRTSSKAEA